MLTLQHSHSKLQRTISKIILLFLTFLLVAGMTHAVTGLPTAHAQPTDNTSEPQQDTPKEPTQDTPQKPNPPGEALTVKDLEHENLPPADPAKVERFRAAAENAVQQETQNIPGVRNLQNRQICLFPPTPRTQ